MSKTLSRTVHVTMTVAVEVPVSEARTVKDAVAYAEQAVDVRNGDVFDSKGKVFDIWTEADQKELDTLKFRNKYVKV